jgi:CheY-like chemotaxis protein
MNLVVNARDAMPDGGEVVLETRNVELSEDDVAGHPGARPGPHVMLAVRDTGCGMDEETKSHLFEPFFTTKEQGKGTGLGLATVFGIIKQSDGHINVESESGRGATFRVFLPRVQPPAPGPKAAPLPPAPDRGSETVLLVEDEEAVRKLACHALRASAYEVMEARDGNEALQVSGAWGGPIHLLVTDVIMPGMNGRQLAERLAPLRPGMKVLYTSGYTDDTALKHLVSGPGTYFLQKPFTPSELAAKVRQVLDGTGGASGIFGPRGRGGRR